MSEDYDITKQKTDKWMQLQKKCKVTGSTLYRTLDLSTLREQYVNENILIECIKTSEN